MKNYPIKNRKIKFSLVGCGRISPNHFGSLEKHSANVELISVCDINPQVLKETTEKYNVPGYLSLDEMLAKSESDVVIITTPSGVHPQQVIKCAKAGRHIITEKPMGTNWQESKEMVRVCDNEEVQLFVVKQNRRNSTLQLLKRAIEQGRFGRIYMVNLNVFWTRPQEYYDQAKWRGTWEYDGGAFMNQASHYIDLLNWMIGPVESVHAYTATLERNIEAEDTGVMSIKWRSGALGSVNVTMLTYPKNLEGSITVLGEKGTVRIGGMAVNEIQHWEFEGSHKDDDKIKSANYETTSVYGFGHPLYYDNVIQTLRGQADPETDGRSGLHSLELLIAAYRSAKEGKRVQLPLD